MKKYNLILFICFINLYCFSQNEFLARPTHIKSAKHFLPDTAISNSENTTITDSLHDSKNNVPPINNNDKNIRPTHIVREKKTESVRVVEQAAKKDNPDFNSIQNNDKGDRRPNKKQKETK